LEPLIPEASPGGRPRKPDMRSAMNAILYLLRTGSPWRYLPRESFAPRSTVARLGRASAVERLSESPKSRSREPVEQLRRVYYLLLAHEPNIGEQAVVEPG
jgi:transposase